MAMRKRADGIVPLCNLAAPRKDERVRGGRGIAPGMAGGDTQARGIASRSSSTASPKGKPRRRRGGFLCPTKVEGVLVGAFYARRRPPTSFPYETENKNGSQLTVRGEPF